MTTHETHVKIARRELIALLRTGALTFPNQPTAAHSVRVDVRIVLHEDTRDEATVRACVDALTEDLAHRYERGWSVEESRYEPGSSEWVGMIVSNADRIELGNGTTLDEATPAMQGAYVARLLKGEEEIRYVPRTLQRPAPPLAPLTPVSRTLDALIAIPVGDATITVSREAADALHVNGVVAGRYEPRSQANCNTVMLAAEALLIHEAMRVSRRVDVLEAREVSFLGGMLSLALTKGTHLTTKQTRWIDTLYAKAGRVEAGEGTRVIRHAAPDVIKCERFTGLAEVK